MEVDAPLLFDFTQRAPGNAVIFDTYGTVASPSTFIGNNTDLSVWRNNRAGSEEHPPYPLPGHDPIDGNAAVFFSNMDFDLRPGNDNFANVNLLANGGSTTEPRFEAWFDGPAMPGTGDAIATGSAGWRQIRRISANNANPVVDILRTPTDADQRIFGHVTIPEGNRSARSAFDGEVFVDLVINDTEGNFVQRINNVPTGTHSIWGDPEHAGVFMAVITEPFADGTTFLPIGYMVEVARARRTAVNDPVPPSTSTTTNEGVEGNIINVRPTRPQDILCRVGTNGTTYCQETVIDVTPPLQVEAVTGWVSGSLRFDGAVTPATTNITGTGEPGAVIRVGRVTPASGNVTGVTWLDGTATVAADGTWEFMIPSGTNLVAEERLSIYISDGVGVASIPVPQLPEVVFRPHLASAATIDWFNKRAIVNTITLPRTADTQPWAGTTMGNINYHWAENAANRTPFHDAIGANAFDYAYILTVEETVESDFQFTKTSPGGTGLAGAEFTLYQRTAGICESTPVGDAVKSGADGVVGFDGLSHGGEYCLRETATPPGFVPLPEGHYWVITVSDTGVISVPVLGPTTPIGTPPFMGSLVGGDLALINQHRTRDFEFIKESQLTELPLAGVTFRLYRRAENGTAWDFIGDLESAAVTGIVSLANLRFGGEYLLIETQALTNYDTPQGPTDPNTLLEGDYWIINVNINDGSIALPTSHGDAPAFIDRNGVFFLPNIRSTVPLFEFTKTEDDGETPLPGARFNLYRCTALDNACVTEDEWVQVRGDHEILELDELVSETAGAVKLENVLTYGTLYRLIETDAPEGFVTPPAGHYWLITVDSTGNVATPTHHEGAPAFDDETDGLFLPNNREGVLFSFRKTNDYLYLSLTHEYFDHLANATFVLSHCVEIEVIVVEGEEENNCVAWEQIETATSTSSSIFEERGIVTFEHLLTLDGLYRLDETVAPIGFRRPAGYWEITWTEKGVDCVVEAGCFVIEAHGTLGLVPAFRAVYRSVATGNIIDNEAVQEYLGEVEIDLYVGNFPETRLPGTGGFGAMSMTIMGLLSLTFVLLFYVRGKIVDDLEKVKKQVA